MVQLRPLIRLHAASFVCITTGSAFALLTPLVLKWLIDVIIPQRRLSLLLCSVALVFVAQQGRIALNSIGSYLMVSAALKFALRLRMQLLKHLDRLSASYFDQTPSGSVLYPLKEPVDEISYFGSDLLPAIMRMVLTTCFTLAAMAALSPVMTLAVLPLIPIFVLVRQHYRKKLVLAADDMQSDRLAWSECVQEHLSSVVSIQLLGQEKRQEQCAFRLMVRSVRSHQRLERSAVGFSISSSLAVGTGMCLVLGYGSASVLGGKLTVGSLVAFNGFIGQLFDPLSGAAELYARTQKICASIRQVCAVLSVRAVLTAVSGPLVLPSHHEHHLSLRHLRFEHSRNRTCLDIPGLEIAPGERVGIMGENGAGKSTLAKLMARVYDPTSGSVQLGGIDISRIALSSLRKTICYLPREPFLFHGTIRSNLLCISPNASEHDLEAALKFAGLSEFIASLPKGIRQEIGPGGCQLSGGQRQALALARAFLQRPKILILDEATSCLDCATENLVIDNLQLAFKDSTVIVISHRPSTIEILDRVLVVFQGRIIRDHRPIKHCAPPPVIARTTSLL